MFSLSERLVALVQAAGRVRSPEQLHERRLGSALAVQEARSWEQPSVQVSGSH